ncbi:hypothetical protein [Novosphingobium profundi]|uniref:hypothetical protein n=1 Tax=Novosphingobium profundi TaxID=1774954 RepID=UPI001CFE27FB|nr:hypothetical protein [Novosphingobium profundi]MED5547615.1 hypothetical protein [Pseudomonadota bacterium]
MVENPKSRKWPEMKGAARKGRSNRRQGLRRHSNKHGHANDANQESMEAISLFDFDQ